jgi:hypothetical protein
MKYRNLIVILITNIIIGHFALHNDLLNAFNAVDLNGFNDAFLKVAKAHKGELSINNSAELTDDLIKKFLKLVYGEVVPNDINMDTVRNNLIEIFELNSEIDETASFGVTKM